MSNKRGRERELPVPARHGAGAMQGAVVGVEERAVASAVPERWAGAGGQRGIGRSERS